MNIVACLGVVLLVSLSVGKAEGVSANDPNLVEMACNKFGALTEAETLLLQKVVNGEVADCNCSPEKDNEPNDIRTGVIRAKLVVWLCTDTKASTMVTYKGIRVKRACIDGELDLSYAKITFPLVFKKSNFLEKISLNYAEISELNLEGTSTRAIDANSVRIDGAVRLCNGFKAEGRVNLQGSNIRCDLDCTNGKFINPDGTALDADGANIEGSVFLRDGFRAEGWVDFRAATVKLYFIMEKIDWTNRMKLCLLSAKIGTFQDDIMSWPGKDLHLNGLVYNEIADEAQIEKIDVSNRLSWLSRQPKFRPQPYEQLATVLRKNGYDVEAKKILIEKNKYRAEHVELTTWFEKLWYRALGPMIGYGYSPLNVLWGIAAFIVLGWSLFKTGYKHGLITPIDESAYAKITGSDGISRADVRQLSDISPKLNYFMYSVDTFVPLIDLYQVKYWQPNAGHGHKIFKIKGFSMHTGGLLRIYFWIHLITGWVLTMLLVAGLSGLVRT